MMVNPSEPTHSEQLQTALLIYPKLLAAARRVTGSMTTAEDVVQEVLLQLVSAPLKPGIAAPASYVMRMVRNLATDHIRRLKYERCLFVEEPVGGYTSDYGSPEDNLRKCEAYRAFQCAVETMPARTRTFYEQHYFDGIPQNVIAQNAGVSCALVCGLLREAHSRCVAAISADVDPTVRPKRRATRLASSQLREVRA